MVKHSNKPGKKKSKRITTQMNSKIHKRSKQTEKKKKKEAKKLRALGLIKKRPKKDLPIPNLYPFKAKIIHAIRKNQELAEKLANHEVDPAECADKTEQFEKGMAEETQLDKGVEVRGGKKYFKEIKKVIENADIILEVIDARDPLGTRNKAVESQVLGMPGDKKLILVMNKIDLVPLENVHAWQNYLRREFPCVLFKANLQHQQQNLSSNALFKRSVTERPDLAEELTSSAKAVGPDHLVQLIKQYSRIEGSTRAVTVGLIGYPNVGKSSVINSLKRSKACGVSPIPGYTKNIQEVKLDRQVKLIDCPGVIFADGGVTGLVLQNTLKVKDEDLIQPLQEIVARVDRDQLLKLYQIADFRTANQFLINVAKARGKLKPGGVPDVLRAAKVVIEDWNRGKIRYFSRVPEAIETQS